MCVIAMYTAPKVKAITTQAVITAAITLRMFLPQNRDCFRGVNTYFIIPLINLKSLITLKPPEPLHILIKGTYTSKPLTVIN